MCEKSGLAALARVTVFFVASYIVPDILVPDILLPDILAPVGVRTKR